MEKLNIDALTEVDIYVHVFYYSLRSYQYQYITSLTHNQISKSRTEANKQ